MKNLDDIRVEINAVDEELQALIIKRLDLAKDVAEYKKANNLPILDRDRELWILDHITEDKSPDLVVPLRETYETLFRRRPVVARASSSIQMKASSTASKPPSPTTHFQRRAASPSAATPTISPSLRRFSTIHAASSSTTI